MESIPSCGFFYHRIFHLWFYLFVESVPSCDFILALLHHYVNYFFIFFHKNIKNVNIIQVYVCFIVHIFHYFLFLISVLLKFFIKYLQFGYISTSASLFCTRHAKNCSFSICSAPDFFSLPPSCAFAALPHGQPPPHA